MKHVFLLLALISTLFISACGGGGGGGSTTPAATAPSAPTGVTITAGNTQVSPSWTAVTDATSYNVYYSTTAGVTIANGTKVAGATSGTAVTGLTNGTPYYCVVTAVNATGESAVSSEVSATPATPPAAPTGITVASGNTQVTLTWPTVTGATSYNVYYRTTTGVTVANGTKITNTSSGTPITGLANGTPYYFVVTVIKGGVESAASSELGTTPQAPTAGVPSGLTISGGNGQVTLGWTAVTGATSYNVYYGTTAGVTVANGTKVTGATSGSAIINLINGTKHYFVVTAMSNANTIENPASAEVSATPMGIPNLMGGAIQTPLTLAGTVTTVATKVSGVATSLGTNANVGSSNPGTFGITTDGTNLYVSTSSGQNGTLYSYSVAIYKKVVITTGETTTMISQTNPGMLLNGGVGPVNADGITTDGNNLYAAGCRMGSTTCWSCFGGYTIKMGLATGKATDIATDFIPVIGGSSLPPLPFAGGTTMDGANLYLTDPTTHTIQKVVIATGAVTTIAGTAGLSGTTDATGAAARFNNPTGITTDGTNLYVADTGNNLIRKVVIADGTVTTVAGGFQGLTYDGTGAGARFTAPRGITTDGANLYVADSGAHAIRKIVIASGVVTTIAGSYGVAGNTNGTGSTATFNEPRSITTDGTSLYVADYTNGVIRKIQ